MWCAIGSSNFDDRSLETNVTLGIKDAATAQRLEALFQLDMQHAVELDAARWTQRGLWHRCKDGFFHAFNELL